MNRNVAFRLDQIAALYPDQIAIAEPVGKYRKGSYQPSTDREYQTLTFAELDDLSSRLAAGFQQMGMGQGHRIAMLVPFGAEFIVLVFALLKAGVTLVLIDPGMGRKNLVRCLSAANPDGFVAIPMAHYVRLLLKPKFPKAILNVTAGTTGRFLPKVTTEDLKTTNRELLDLGEAELTDPAAIIFTTGSTGPPKGVLYTHQTFNHQVDQIQHHYGIEPGGRDLSGFPLFGLFNALMGTTTIVPDMDPTRPANVEPQRLLDAMAQWKVNQAFGSPALWTRVGRYCEQEKVKIPTLNLILSAGAPVPPQVLRAMRDATPEDAHMFTPYGATEALPVASIESREVLRETAKAYFQGQGTCVGKRFDGIRWKVIEISDGPITDWKHRREVGIGEIGELMVCGPVVSTHYATRREQDLLHKVQDAQGTVWHRMGDVGYLDEQDRFWFCGRKSQRVESGTEVWFTDPCEGIVNADDHVRRSALVGIQSPTVPEDDRVPIMVLEPWDRASTKGEARKLLVQKIHSRLQEHRITSAIQHVLVYPREFPTDIRHNAKIFREKLAVWAKKQRLS